MNIIICGAGKVGFSISKQLSAQGHSVTVIDQSSEDIKKINDTQDVKGIVGRATLPTVLENAGAEKADMVIAVTRNDETNMIVCQLASSLFNVSKKIARIRTKDFLEGKWGKLYNKSNIPIDVIISPELEVAKSLYRRLEAPGALDSVPFGNDKVKMLEISIEKNCPIKNIPLKDLTKKFPDFKANILAALRKEKLIYLKKDDKILEGDNVYVVASSVQLNQILKAFGHDEKAAKNILIIGGGNIGLNLAKMLETNFEEVRVKIIEKDKKRAEEIANELSSSIVINGDALDEEILKEANLEDSETVLALTNDDENNMMACVLAEKTGLKKRTIAIVNKTNYNLLQDSLNIDDLVDPRMTTVSRIMEHVHRGTIGTVYSLLDGKFEFIEAKILEKSELLNKKIRDSNLPEDIRIGAIVRKDQVIIPRSNFIFEKDDLVVFLAKREQLQEVESIFSLSSV
ncbi:MAG: Trk system potassium transporter TrkA [Candidatus Pelagibacter sp. TMED263]|nr:MAG: Trk system potassium transporter TrkA [Candidatus Pelagibacter sp. TMED263]|tara:strand:- start:604 stop:1977 length:1374 start_codon:yes stop_codon:yes gene_type:complete